MHSPSEAPEAYSRYLGEYLDALRNFEPRTLEAGMNLTRGSWTGLTWPPPGYIAKHCRAVEYENRPPFKPELVQLPPPPKLTEEESSLLDERVARHMKLLKTGDIVKLNDNESNQLWLTGEEPEGFRDRPDVTTATAKPQNPKPPTPRQVERAARLQRRGNAARVGFIGTGEEKINVGKSKLSSGA